MHHEWECPDCGEELYHECETEDNAVNHGLPDYETLKQSAAIVEANLRAHFSQGLNKPNTKCEAECAEHPAHDWDGTPVPQGEPGDVPCLCQGPSHHEGCPNWELPY